MHFKVFFMIVQGGQMLQFETNLKCLQGGIGKMFISTNILWNAFFFIMEINIYW